MENSGEQKDFAGKNGFTWWIGVVEDRQDPIKMGRCRVRCIGWDSDNKMHVPTSSLPWAMPMLPVNNPHPYAPKEGDMVVGFFIDGENAQERVVMGVFPGLPLKASNAQQAFSDPRTTEELNLAPVKPNETATGYPRKLDEPTTSRLARNETITDSIVSLKKAKKASKVEPDPYYNAKYPYNNVYESESGHAMEFDDTKGSERIHLYHRSGSYVEYGPDGSRSERIQKDKFTVVVGNDSVYVSGDVTVYIDGNAAMTVGGNATMTVGGAISASSGGNATLTAGGNIVASSGGNATLTAGGSVNITSGGDLTATASSHNLIGTVNVTGDIIVSGQIII
jgi:hypothetical protein